ncbi:MAG: hypothetical protein K8U57_16905 [Planctomycetes bacterium]|nr:hypothetical protein [Planctomycetota bacterium]
MFHHRWLVLVLLVVPFSSGCGRPKPSTGGPADSRDPPPGSPSATIPPPAGSIPNPAPGGSRPTALTSTNFKKIKSTSTREELVALFGPPRTAVTGVEIAEKLLGNPAWGAAYESEVAVGGAPVDLLAYLEDGRVLVIGVDRNKASGGSPHAGVVRAWMATRTGDPQTGTLTYETLLGDGGRLRYSQKTVPVPAANR